VSILEKLVPLLLAMLHLSNFSKSQLQRTINLHPQYLFLLQFVEVCLLFQSLLQFAELLLEVLLRAECQCRKRWHQEWLEEDLLLLILMQTVIILELDKVLLFLLQSLLQHLERRSFLQVRDWYLITVEIDQICWLRSSLESNYVKSIRQPKITLSLPLFQQLLLSQMKWRTNLLVAALYLLLKLLVELLCQSQKKWLPLKLLEGEVLLCLQHLCQMLLNQCDVVLLL
jgi:hypothetical protein